MENAIGILIRIALSLLIALRKYGHSNLNTESSFFALVSLAKGLSVLFIFSKNQFLVSLLFSVVFLVSISCSNHHRFLHSTNFGLVLVIFSQCPACRVRLFETFLAS